MRASLRVAAALVLLAPACSATWEGMKRDSERLFSGQAMDVAEVQRRLNERGYSAGPADGVLGPQTAAAIRSYQTDYGLPVTGDVDERFVEHLRETLPAPRPAASAPTSPSSGDAWVNPH